MKHLIFLIAAFVCTPDAHAQRVIRDIPYGKAHERQVLDVHAPAGAKNLPVVFWIHGGGWQTGDKSMVALKPKAFMDAGFVFVSINHRLLPTVAMDDITRDVASALGWVYKNIAAHGGDPARVFVMGHSSGGQLAALMCVDDRYAKAEGFPLTVIKGCVPTPSTFRQSSRSPRRAPGFTISRCRPTGIEKSLATIPRSTATSRQ
jgi:acetyl esterase/lipase